MSSRSDMNKMGKHIAELRKKKGYTQKKLGDLIDVSDKTISKWEKGVIAPDITILSSLASTLDITVEELLLGEEKQELDTVEAINVYSKITKRKLIKHFLIFILLIALCTFFVFRIEKYYSWHLTQLFNKGEVYSKGYILSNNKESKILINKIGFNEDMIDKEDFSLKIKSTEIFVIYNDEVIYNELLNYSNDTYLSQIFNNYIISFDVNYKISKEKLNIRILCIDENENKKINNIEYK